MTVEDISKNLKVSWGLIKRIDKAYLEAHYTKPRLKDVTWIGIDEFAVKRGHKYHTVVVDLLSGQVIYVGKGRSSESLKPFWRRLKASGAQLEAVAMDMWPAYINSVTNHLPDAKIIYDKFHIVKNLNTTLSELRKSVFRVEKDLNKKTVLKGTRWILLKNQDNLSEERSEKARLEEALAINKPLSIAYYLKEDLKLIWCQETIEKAKKFLGQWVAKAYASGIKQLRKFANSLLAHRTGIFNWYSCPISTAKVEGINNKIKVLKRRAYGYRDMDYFNLKIMAMHQSRYAL